MEGSLSNEIKKIQDILLNMIAHIEVSIDFPDEDVEEITFEELEKQGKDVSDRIKKTFIYCR